MKKLKKGNIIYIGGICVVFVLCGIYMCYRYIHEQRVIESMNITFNEVAEIEYGTKDFDIQKELIKKIENANLQTVSSIDTMKLGEQTLKFVLTKDGLEKEIEYKIQVKDTKSPEVKFKKTSIEVILGEKVNTKENIEFVKDIVDGDIKEIEKAFEINKKATEEYNNLKNENINDNTKVVDKSLGDFSIEDIKGKDTIQLFLKNCYYVQSDVDTSKVGKYKVTVIAVDKNGLKTSADYQVTVKEQKNHQSTISNQNQNKMSNGVPSSKTQKSQSNQTSKKGISAVVHSALSQVGTPYVYGGSAPGGFDCSGLIYWSYNTNGYNIPRAVRSAGHSIGTNLAKADVGDIIVTPGHVSLIIKKTAVPSDDNITRYSIKLVQAVNGDGVVADSLFGHIVREDGTLEQNSLNILDIRRVR